MTTDEFLAWQEREDGLYELVDGVPVLPLKMMTGASQAHDRVVVNVIRELANQLRGGPCRPTTDDLAVRVPGGNVRRPPVAHILLIDTETPRIDMLSRGSDGSWVQIKHDGLDARIDLPAIQASLLLADVFEGLDFVRQPDGDAAG